ncbi:MAG: type II toxin-antitoxin system VapC family toxin [Alcanivoracaceae bacterium]
MNVVDSSAWLSFFAGDQNAAVFAAPIEDVVNLLVPSITLTEVFKCILRQRDEESALLAVAHMSAGRVVALDTELAIEAGHYGVQHKLPLADSIIYATAKKYGATVWTQDADFDGLTGVKYVRRKK